MPLKDLITLAIALTALLLSVLAFRRTRRTDRLALRQSLIDKKYTTLAQEAEQHAQIFRLILRLMAIETESDDVTSLRKILSDILESGEGRLKRLSELKVDHLDDEADLTLRETLGLLSEQAALLAKAEVKVATLEVILRYQNGPQ
jgi:hypothetical protein